MKKLLLIIFGAFLFINAQSQVIFQESFSGGSIPIPGWMILGNTQNFDNPQTADAGGTAPELVIDNTPTFPSTTMRIISPQINTTGATKLIIRFKHMFAKSGGSTPFIIGVDTRVSGGSWNNVWNKSATATINAEGVTILVDNANVGASNFQFCFYITGASTNMSHWNIDDVEVIKPLALDGAISSVDLPALFNDIQPIKGKIANLGNTAINTIDVNWKVDDGEVHTTSLTGLNVTTGLSADYLSADSLDLPEGEYTLYVWISNVNGITTDDDPSNDMITRDLSIPDRIIFYKPLFEEFTSSTCAPCASFNSTILNPFIASHTDEDLTLVKYQMNWPGSGDIYYTAEGGQRRSYYNVSYVPDLYIDGAQVATTAAGVNGGYNATSGTMASVAIESVHNISGNNVIIDCNIIPYLDYNNVKVHFAIIEKVTTQNVGSNGETEFHHVMMDMVPTGNGTSANLVAGEVLNFQHNVDMSTTNVEEMDDLMVAVFIQQSDKKIVQSGYSVETGAIVSSSVLNNAVNVPVGEPITISFSQPVRMIGGAPLTNQNVANIIRFKEVDHSGASVGFQATINDAKTLITITPDPNLKFNQMYYLEILPVENLLSVPTVSYVINFTTLLNINVIDTPVVDFKLYPNPVNNQLYISNLNNVRTVEIYSIVGNLVKSVELSVNSGTQSINVSNLPAGLYILKGKGNGFEKAMRFVVSR
ncbi:MAG TPA: T9SS type A sorting domain-containing protein [Lentimicrobium sp.]|nr:T9SS type A sorting domain-containing protein [Lentimicrobium sp.]